MPTAIMTFWACRGSLEGAEIGFPSVGQLHPDANPGDKTAEQIQGINEAYETAARSAAAGGL